MILNALFTLVTDSTIEFLDTLPFAYVKRTFQTVSTWKIGNIPHLWIKTFSCNVFRNILHEILKSNMNSKWNRCWLCIISIHWTAHVNGINIFGFYFWIIFFFVLCSESVNDFIGFWFMGRRRTAYFRSLIPHTNKHTQRRISKARKIWIRWECQFLISFRCFFHFLVTIVRFIGVKLN